MNPGPYLEEENQILKAYDEIMRTVFTWTRLLFQMKDLENSISVILTYCHSPLG